MKSRYVGLIFGVAWLAAVLAACGQPAPVAPSPPLGPSPSPETLPPRSISLSVPKTVADRMRPVTIRYSYRDIPPGSWMVLSLEPDRTGRGYNESGPVTMEPIAISGSGAGAFVWDSYRVGCAPIDVPQWCAAGVGPHRITATVYDQEYLGLGRMRPQVPLVVRARAESRQFNLGGDKDYGSARLALEGKARQTYFLKARAEDAAMPLPMEDFVLSDGRLTRRLGIGCMRFEARPPLAGGLTACGKYSKETDGRPRDMHGTWVVDNNLRWREGEPRLADSRPAVLAALRKAFPTLTDTIPAPAGVWSAPRSMQGIYRAEQRTWVLRMGVYKRNSKAYPGPTEQRMVMMLVDGQGKACVVENVEGYRFSRELEDPTVRCPGP